MIIKLVNRWFFMSLNLLVLTVILSLKIENQFIYLVFFMNIIILSISYFILVNEIGNDADKYSSSSLKKKILIISTCISFLAVISYNLIYYYYTNSFFEFSAVDSLEYHQNAIWMKDHGIIQSIKIYINSGIFLDDLGANLLTSLAYRVYPSTFTFNLFNVIAGVITLLAMYSICISFMSKKLAYLATLFYGVSSFVLYLYSTGMKESFFSMFVVLFFGAVLKYWRNKSPFQLIYVIIFISIIYFFRPAVSLMLLISIVVGFLFSKGKNLYSIVVLILIIGFGALNYSEIIRYKELYEVLTSEDVVSTKQNLKPTPFNYSASFLSAAVGPLPTYYSLKDREQQAFYSIGLGMRVLLAVPFWMVLFTVFKKRNSIILAMSIFTILEMFILSMILESFELRLNSPHLPIVYILAFYFFHEFQYFSYRKQLYLKRIFDFGIVLMFLIIIAWNLRL